MRTGVSTAGYERIDWLVLLLARLTVHAMASTTRLIRFAASGMQLHPLGVLLSHTDAEFFNGGCGNVLSCCSPKMMLLEDCYLRTCSRIAWHQSDPPTGLDWTLFAAQEL